MFDWDGTLADTRKAILFSFHKALNSINFDVSDEFIERRIGIGAAETFIEILKEKGAAFDAALIKRLVEIKVQAEIDVTSEVKLFEGAEELLEALHGKVKLALASMNNRDVINHMLKELKVKRFFEVVLTAEEVSKPKPNPEIFLKSACKINSSPEKCVVMEDSIFGVKAAKAAKMGCIAVLAGVYSREELGKAMPDLIVNSLMEKEPILKFII
ncbi:MAG TPA: HAD family phosphatase [Candidatus Bathyarchaeia archaeon]|nr:HAD family phosphatase [Candidatus Bathyarchaeia archaeon]